MSDNQPSNEVDELIHNIVCQPMTEARNIGYAEAENEDVTDLLEFIEKTEIIAKQAIEDMLVEARLDELSNVQLQYGHYVAQTFINGQAMTLEERIADLKSKRGSNDG